MFNAYYHAYAEGSGFVLKWIRLAPNGINLLLLGSYQFQDIFSSTRRTLLKSYIITFVLLSTYWPTFDTNLTRLCICDMVLIPVEQYTLDYI